MAIDNNLSTHSQYSCDIRIRGAQEFVQAVVVKNTGRYQADKLHKLPYVQILTDIWRNQTEIVIEFINFSLKAPIQRLEFAISAYNIREAVCKPVTSNPSLIRAL